MNIGRTYRRAASIVAFWALTVIAPCVSTAAVASHLDASFAMRQPQQSATIVLAMREPQQPASSTNNYQSWAG